MKRLLPSLVIITLVFSGKFLVASESYNDREIFVMFRTGKIGMHGLMASSPDGIDISSNVRGILSNFNAEAIIRAVPGFSPTDTIALSHDGRIVRKPNLSLLYKIRFPAGTNLDAVVRRLSDCEEIIYAERIPVYRLSSTIPNDPLFNFQWGLMNRGQYGGGNPGADIAATEAWDICRGSSSVKIGIIDCGVMKNHEDLSGKVEGDDTYLGYHGTHVAGVAGAVTNNGIGIAGVDWYAPIYAKDASSDNEPGKIDVAKAVSGIIEAVDAGCSVLNNSWGGYAWSITVRSAFAYAYKMNRVSVAGAGNDETTDPMFPAAYPNVIAVGAMTRWGERCSFSNYGTYLDVVAPGEYIISTQPDPDNKYDFAFGTSVAAPFVTGIAALLKSYEPSLYNDDIEEIIELSADDITGYGTGWDIYTGWGKVNARRALDLLRAPYSLVHQYAGGAQTVTDMGRREMAFIGVEGLADGVYFPKMYRVEKDVFIDKLYAKGPYLWGCGVATRGFSAESPNYGEGYTKVTSMGGGRYRLTTYVYDIFMVDGSHVGYFPCEPSQVRFAYSILGIEDKEAPVVWVTSPNGGKIYRTNETIPIRWQVQDEYLEGIRCSISYKVNGSNLWITIASNVKVASDGSGEYNYVVPCGKGSQEWTIRVIANDTNAHQGFDDSDGLITVEYLSKPGNEPIPREQGSNVVRSDFVSAPFPNPFNPLTYVKFGLRSNGMVSIKVFDADGRLVRTVVDRVMGSGEHTVFWDGRNDAGKAMPSGIYFLRFETRDYSGARKLILLR